MHRLETESVNAGLDPEPLEGDDAVPLRPASLADLAYQRIEAIILSGRVKGGERLNDSRLARAFSVSRGPVRSALVRLAEVGLVEIIPYRGAFVRAIDFDDIMEIYEVRAAVERAGVLAASRNMTPKVLVQLRRYITKMNDAFERGDTEQYFRTNLDFHELIHRTSGNGRLLELYERYTREQKLFRHFALAHGGIAESNEQHLRIMQALEAGDGERAAREMEDHVISARERLARSVRDIKDELPRS
ncbi:DNA-binding GntR family transcriptional regulator OS=Castellaniella defragrans OX=75697 GN=HNR28_001081 PE=4 SV=1 [Castellaniella defragrans]